jgi:CubicO group peptidase (beta-lactamase class C family)
MSKMKSLFLSLFFLTILSGSSQDFKSQLDSLIQKYDSEGSFNGIIIIAFDPKNVKTFEYGYKDPSTKKEKISIKDRFDLASLAKQFTGLAILQLIEKGIISADVSIGKYFPELKSSLQKVTIRQLANHTNGIHDFYSLTKNRDSLDNHKILSMLSKLDTTVFVPGSKWGYSNSGYVLLSVIIERITNSTFQNHCSKNILAPLKMKTSCFATTDKTILYGYNSKNEKENIRTFNSGASGLYASGNDIINYYKSVNKDSAYWNKYFSMSRNLAENCNEKNWTYGFGWYFSEDDSGKFRAHSGNNFGFYNYIRWYEKSNTFLCILSNKNDAFIKPLREEVLTLIKKTIKK